MIQRKRPRRSLQSGDIRVPQNLAFYNGRDHNFFHHCFFSQGGPTTPTLERPEPEPPSSRGEKLIDRRAYFEQLLVKTVATVAVSGASSLVAPPRRSFAASGFAFEEPGSKWTAEVRVSIFKFAFVCRGS